MCGFPMIARILTIPLSDWKLIGRDVFTVAALFVGAASFIIAMGVLS